MAKWLAVASTAWILIACGGGSGVANNSLREQAIAVGQEGRARAQTASSAPAGVEPAFPTGAVYALRNVANRDLLLQGLSDGEPVFAPIGFDIPRTAKLLLADVPASATHCFRLIASLEGAGMELSPHPEFSTLSWRRSAPEYERMCAQVAPGGVGYIVRSGGQVLTLVRARIQFLPEGLVPSPILSAASAWEFVKVTPPTPERAPVKVKFFSVRFDPALQEIAVQATAYVPDGVVSRMELFAGDTHVDDFTLRGIPSAIFRGEALGTVLRIKVTDDRGAISWSAPLKLHLDALNRPVPAGVSLLGLRDGMSMTLGAFLALDAQVFMPQLTESSVSPAIEIYSGTKLVASRPALVSGSAPPLTWFPPAVGSYVLRAKAISETGLESVMSAPVKFTVTATNKAPIVSIRAPNSGSGRLAGDVVIVDSNPSDEDGYIRRVDFFDGTLLIGSATAAPWSIVWVGEPGPHSLTARAFDNSDASTTSQPVLVTLKASNTAPTVSIKSPAGGSILAVGEAVSVSSAPGDTDGYIRRVEFFDGSTLIGTATTKPWAVTWTPTAGSHTLTAKAVDNSDVSTTSKPVVVTAAP